MPASAKCWATYAVFVSTSWPSNNSVPTATSSTASGIEPLRIVEGNVSVKTFGSFDHRGTARFAMLVPRPLSFHLQLHFAKALDESRKALVHGRLQSLLKLLADAR